MYQCVLLLFLCGFQWILILFVRLLVWKVSVGWILWLLIVVIQFVMFVNFKVCLVLLRIFCINLVGWVFLVCFFGQMFDVVYIVIKIFVVFCLMWNFLMFLLVREICFLLLRMWLGLFLCLKMRLMLFRLIVVKVVRVGVVMNGNGYLQCLFWILRWKL